MTAAKPAIAAVITARGGSKGVPGKNLRPLLGKPLLAYAVEAARQCALIDRVVVTTDDAAIADAARRLGATIVDRPAHLATDDASSADAVAHALESLSASGERADVAVLLQPTSPLRTSAHLAQCIEAFLAGGFSASVSVCRAETHPWKTLLLRDGTAQPVQGWEHLERPRLTLLGAYHPNGAIYVVKTDPFLKARSFFLQPLTLFEMSPDDSIDIDTERDLALAERALRERAARGAAAAAWGGAAVRFSKAMDMRRLNRTPAWRREVAADQAALSARVGEQRGRAARCPICAEAKSAPLVSVFGFDYVQCARCGHVYSKTPPDERAVKRLYAGDAAGDGSVQHKIYLDKEIFHKRVADIAVPKVRYVSEFAQGSRDGTWIDVGCGTGEVVAAAARQGWRAMGVESDRAECDFARSMGADVVHRYVTEDNARELFAGASVVSFFNILEHIADPAGLLRSVAQSLPRGCLVAAEVPRHPSVSSLSNCLFPEMAARHIYAPDHLHAFTDDSFGRLIAGFGIRPLGVWYFGQDFFDLVCSAAAASGLGDSELYGRAVDLAPEVQPVIDRSGLADTLFVVGTVEGKDAQPWRAISG